MIVKDFLLSMDVQKLSKVYFDMYYKNDEISIAEAKRHNCDLASHINDLVKCLLNQIATIGARTSPNKRIIIANCVGLEISDDWEAVKHPALHAYYINLNDVPDLGQLQHITTMENQSVNPFDTMYGLNMMPWEELLGIEIGYWSASQYAAAACILFEMTFWGYNQEQHNAKIKAIEAELEQAEKEIEAGNYSEYNDEDFRNKFNLTKPTPAQKEREQRLYREIYVENYNISVDIYNKLQADGLFQKHTPN